MTASLVTFHAPLTKRRGEGLFAGTLCCGFLDAPDVQKRFEAAPDEAYSRPIEGTIER